MNIESFYLLDAVTLSKLKSNHLSAQLVKEKCHITEEIAYEAKDYPYYNEHMQPLILKLDIKVLDFTKQVLQSLGTNSRLVDLFKNEGNGDVQLLATALTKKDENKGQLFGADWTIVSDDNRLRKSAQSLNIDVLSTEEFIALL